MGAIITFVKTSAGVGDDETQLDHAAAVSSADFGSSGFHALNLSSCKTGAQFTGLTLKEMQKMNISNGVNQVLISRGHKCTSTVNKIKLIFINRSFWRNNRKS